MIELAMEVPTAYLYRWTPFTDLDFALAHRVLEDEPYAEFYATRAKGRTLILDNSMHELGTPLPIDKLRAACERVHADITVAPDRLGEPLNNLMMYREMRKSWNGVSKIAVVLAGRNKHERAWYLDEVQDAEVICLPFREPRWTWCKELSDKLCEWNHIHLLGVNELVELSRFKRLAAETGTDTRWSVDTSKPIKWGYAGRTFTTALKTLRGAPLTSLELLDLKDLHPDQLTKTEFNIKVLRKHLS